MKSIKNQKIKVTWMDFKKKEVCGILRRYLYSPTARSIKKKLYYYED